MAVTHADSQTMGLESELCYFSCGQVISTFVGFIVFTGKMRVIIVLTSTFLVRIQCEI